MSEPAPALDGRDYESETFEGLVAPEIERSGIAFYDCTFSGCNLARSRLADCRFVACTFVDCDLGLIDLADCVVREGSFEDCKLIGVVWSRLRSDPGLPPEIDLFRCDLAYGDFSDLDLSERRLQGCRLHDATFARTKLVGADLRDSDLTGATFVDCDLRRADLRGATNYRIDPRGNRVEGGRYSVPEVWGLLEGLGIELS